MRVTVYTYQESQNDSDSIAATPVYINSSFKLRECERRREGMRRAGCS